MKTVAFAVLVAALALMSGCACEVFPMHMNGCANASAGRYQLAGDGQGRFMKIDSRTGDTWIYATNYPTGNSWIKLH